MSSLFGAAGSSSTAQASSAGDISKDIAINTPPEDSISGLAWHPTADVLAVSSWDSKVRIYEVAENGQSQGKALITHGKPVLCTDFSSNGQYCASGSADNTAKVLDLNNPSSDPVTLTGHEAPIRSTRFVQCNGQEMLVTGSWDKTIKYWDLRSPNPAASVNCQERVYTMDSKNKLLVIGTADRYINIVNLDQPGVFHKTMQSPLKFQTRVVSCFTDATGFAVGSVEGRCAIQYVDEKDATNNFSFKCHRDTPQNQRDVSNVFSVNDISFHPVHGTFSTAGSDGTFHFWDKDAKHRLKGYPNVGGPIAATRFNRNGNIFAYAISYDWSQGYQKNGQSMKTTVMLHAVLPDEVKPRPKNGGRR
ncbi:MAG: hypothetical protein Q9227_005960 [Pyrenula ochraceoflavens]